MEEKSANDFIKIIKEFGKRPSIEELDSVILKNKENKQALIELISKKIECINMKLLYRASKDGVEYNDLFNKINNKSNLIFLYLSGNKRIFGNYVNTKLENLGNETDKYYNDEKSFVFSLNDNKIYNILIPEKAIRFYKQEYSILIGNTGIGNGFYFCGKTIIDTGLLKKPKIYDFGKNKELTEGENSFNELEIFQII